MGKTKARGKTKVRKTKSHGKMKAHRKTQAHRKTKVRRTRVRRNQPATPSDQAMERCFNFCRDDYVDARRRGGREALEKVFGKGAKADMMAAWMDTPDGFLEILGNCMDNYCDPKCDKHSDIPVAMRDRKLKGMDIALDKGALGACVHEPWLASLRRK